MRIDNYRIAPISEVRRAEAAARAERAESAGISPSGEDLLALTTGTNPISRDVSVEALASAWKNGTFRPDPARIADRLIEWGFSGVER